MFLKAAELQNLWQGKLQGAKILQPNTFAIK